MKRLFAVAACAFLLVACKERPGQNTYGSGDVGISHAVEFGTVLNVREVDITGENSGTGTLLGAGVGAGAGSYVGKGDGNAWATAGAAIVGAVAGHYAEQAMNDRKGFEYVVNLQSGETKTIVQEQHEGDVVFKAGDKVMIQYCDAGDKSRKCADGKQYQRLLPVQKLPPYAKKRKKYVSHDVDAPEVN